VKIEERYPGVEVVCEISPPFRPRSPLEVLVDDRSLRLAQPDIIWVGLGTPKQDVEVARLAALGHLAVAVGAAFDFTSGDVKEAPRAFRVAGLEWLHRLFTEPRRLWRRYLIGNIVFLRAVMREAVNRG
jgi:N-acetylglucosaminyldiphosphoundecaprenol N-acetyl-beta-D-mannosaminyltransferase